MSKEKTASRWGGKGVRVGIIACVIVMVAGIVLWMVQLTGGMIQTGMRNRCV